MRSGHCEETWRLSPTWLIYFTFIGDILNHAHSFKKTFFPALRSLNRKLPAIIHKLQPCTNSTSLYCVCMVLQWDGDWGISIFRRTSLILPNWSTKDALFVRSWMAGPRRQPRIMKRPAEDLELVSEYQMKREALTVAQLHSVSVLLHNNITVTMHSHK